MQPIQPLETYHTGINPVNASQLLSLLSERQLTPEQFDKIIPHTKEFLSDVKDLLSRQTEIDKLNHDQYIDNSFRVIDRLLTTMQENPTETERRYFLETINKIHDRISEVQKK